MLSPLVFFGKRLNSVLFVLLKSFCELLDLVLHVAVAFNNPVFECFSHLALHLRLNPTQLLLSGIFNFLNFLIQNALMILYLY
jgi:hypothetical protein